MIQELMVSCDDYETQVAILEDGRVTEVFRSGDHEQETRGDIYLGRVKSVLPGIQVAFVDIGLERDAFLHVSDILWSAEIVKQIPRNDAVALTEACRHLERQGRGAHEPINQLLTEGQVLLVQIDKAAIREKGPRVTTQIRIPGRYLVLMPTSRDIGVSRRIAAEDERRRLRDLVLRLRPDDAGYIVRTVAEKADEDEIHTDMQALNEHWHQIQQEARKRRAPATLHQEDNLVLRIIRDRMSEDTTQILIDSPQITAEVRDYLKEHMPHLADRAQLYQGTIPLFDARGITQELKRALRQKVWLPCGAYIIIEQTEALVVIDVRQSSVIHDPLRVNLEAVDEIVRQIRLRDVGGIVVIDFLDMDSPHQRKRVHGALHRAIARDRAATNILRFSELGLVQMTRQRTKQSLQGSLCAQCPYCEGQGWILSEETITLDVLRHIKQVRHQVRKPGLKVIANEVIADRLRQQERDKVEALKKSLKFQIEIVGDLDLHLEDYRILNLQNGSEIYSSF